MATASSLIKLVNTLSKAEKQKFSIYTDSGKNRKGYAVLFNIINRNKSISQKELKTEYEKLKPDTSFYTAVTYLYNLLLDMLTELRVNQDIDFKLYSSLLKAKTLNEKNMPEECLSMLKKIKHQAKHYENMFVLLIAQRMELNYYSDNNFINLTEQQLLNRQMKINTTIKIIRKLNEQASIYELLQYRTLFRGNARSARQQKELNDLVISELSIVSDSGFENFEIKKMHQLFQSQYLINVGDYKAALNSYKNLNKLFEGNQSLWGNPPVYYLQTIEGVLESLRSIKNYSQMNYFIERLERLDSHSLQFNCDVKCTIFLYRLFQHLDTGDFEEAELFAEKNASSLLEKYSYLNITKQIILSFYCSLTYLCSGKTKTARKFLKPVIKNWRTQYLPSYSDTISLLNMMIHYELGNTEQFTFLADSMKKNIKSKANSFLIEDYMITLMSKTIAYSTPLFRQKLWTQWEKKVNALHGNKYEMQILHLFDFTAWIESRLTDRPLSEIIKRGLIAN